MRRLSLDRIRTHMAIPSATVGPRDLGVVLGLYFASTALYWLLGVTFDTTTVSYFMQFIDTKLLETRLLESIWYYHATPPMLNLLTGIGIKLFGGHDAFFSICFHILGLLTALSVYLLTWKLSESRITAGIATGLLVFNPDFVLFQNWLMYEFPAVALLTMSAVALYQYVRTRSTKWGVAFFALLAALLLTRSVFHIAWMVLVAVILAVLWRGEWRKVLIAAALPLLVVAGWYGKNLYYFGTFSSSSWLGLGFVNISTLLLTRPELEAMVERGEISGLALVSRYDQLPVLFSTQDGPPSGIPVLDEPITSEGVFNFNYRPMVAISRTYMQDGVQVVRAHPGAYLMGLGLSNLLFFSPNHINPFTLRHNRRAGLMVGRWITPVLYGVSPRVDFIRVPRFGYGSGPDVPIRTSVPLMFAWVIILAYGYVQARKSVRAATPADQARAIVLGFIVLTCLYIYVVGTAVELAENSRYRFLTEPLFMVLAATAVTALVRRLRNMRRRSDVTTPEPERASV
jgi:4-amino-4-deoxy-L-arabinose transferase-like glycosyltransferase